ncbi:MAG: hypothetical protein ACWGSQ_08600 [Longimicrobiales bacterium]
MRWIVLSLVAGMAISWPGPLTGQDEGLPYEDRYKDNLLYLHALVGYEFGLWNDFEWERRRVAGNGLRLSYGSVSTRDLLTNADVRINQPLGRGWLFLGQYREYASLHLQTRQQAFWGGFEKYVSHGLSAFLRVNPLPDKEFMDGELGLSLTDSGRERYLRVALQVNDLNYDLKNELGGVSDRTPLGVRWLLRAERGNIWVTSDGRWGRGFARSFEDPEKSPDLRFFEQAENQGRVRLYYQRTARWLLELSGHHYRFSEEKSYHGDGTNDYRYRNRISLFGVRYALNPGSGHGLTLDLLRVQQESRASGYRSFLYDRREWLPAASYSYTRGSHALLLGYMGSLYSWDFDDQRGVDSFQAQDMTEKVKLGYTYRFSERGSVHLSVSHVFSFFGFGGGNVQFNLGF